MSAVLGAVSLRTKIIFLLLVFFSLYLHSQEADFVSIYDDLSDTNYGRSVNRSIVRGVRLDRFGHYRSLDVEQELLDGEKGFLTPLVFSDNKKQLLNRGAYPFITNRDGLYYYSLDGLDFAFSLEKAGSPLLLEIDSYYEDWPQWREPVRNHYLENWVIRIHRAENVFEPWVDLITYNEALLAASVIADGDQWLWGVKDGSDVLSEN